MPAAAGVRAAIAAMPAVRGLVEHLVDLLEDIPRVLELLDIVRMVGWMAYEVDERDLHPRFDNRLAGHLELHVVGVGAPHHNTTGAADTLHAPDALDQGLARLPHGLDDRKTR